MLSVGSPAGTMIQTERGGSSFETRSSSEEAPVAPWPSASLTASALKSNATHLWSESRWMRWTMFAAHLAQPDEAQLHQISLLNSFGGVSLEPHLHGRQPVIAKRLQVAHGLGVLQVPERVAGLGYLDVLFPVVDQLEEAARWRSPLVELAGGVQEARSVAERGGALGTSRSSTRISVTAASNSSEGCT